MKRILTVGVMVTMAGIFSSCAAPATTTNTAAVATTTASTANRASDEQEVRRLNLEYDNAILKQDAAVFERLFADDFVVIKIGGKLSAKAQEIAEARSGETKFEVGRSEDVKVRFYGDTAIVNGRWVEKSVTKGKPFEGSHLYTTVYVKQGGKWQIVSDQVTPVTP
jgi:uncharacterized protein (TIGR02246 family)